MVYKNQRFWHVLLLCIVENLLRHHHFIHDLMVPNNAERHNKVRASAALPVGGGNGGRGSKELEKVQMGRDLGEHFVHSGTRHQHLDQQIS